jgi:transcriptional regulator with GAF, ATPase, and Fis domain
MLTLDDFPGISAALSQHTPAPAAALTAATDGIYSLFGRLPTFREIEDYLIVEALKLSEGSFASAASKLGVTRQTISKRFKSIKSAPEG